MPRESNLKRKELPSEFEVPELMFAELDSLLGYTLRRAQGAMHRDFMAAVSDFGLTQKQAAVLWLIQANGGVSQVEVAAALGMDRATMMALTDRLEDRGFVIRKRSTVDRRRQELYLTPSGQSTLRKCKTRIAEHEEKFRAMFTASELAALIDALKKFQNPV
ncbi:MAG TPA: MarR family transcriptional regulator [Steroidobacteraceae bacterium]|nr:MarR family transcriptional regulator [Steroidobacteraceae bacterium]